MTEVSGVLPTANSEGEKRQPERYPWVKGRCPACKEMHLFVGSGGFITCSWIDCPNPGAAHDLLIAGGTPTDLRMVRAHIGHVLNDDGTCWTCAEWTAERVSLKEGAK